MAKLSNSPTAHTVLTLEQRKSFAFSIELASPGGRPVDLSAAAVTFTLGSLGTYDAPPTVILERAATVADPATGRAVVSIQADELDLDADSYPFVVVLRSAGYSLVVVKGEVQLQPNVEIASTSHDYAGGEPSTGLLVELVGSQVVRVVLDSGLPAGVDGGLVATGVGAGWVPTAQGDGTWEWRPGNEHTHSANQITSGTLDTARIANWSLRQSKVTQATPDNLMPNSMFELGDKLYPWTQDPRFTWTTDDIAPGSGSPGCIVTLAGLGTNTIYATEPFDAGFALEHGVRYEFEMWIKADKPDSRIYVEVRDEDGSHAMDWASVEGGAAMTQYPVGSWVVPTTWTHVVSRGVARTTIASTASRARMGSWYLNHAAGTERNASYKIAGFRIRRQLAPLVAPEFTGPVYVEGDIELSGRVSSATAVIGDVSAPTVRGVTNLNPGGGPVLYRAGASFTPSSTELVRRDYVDAQTARVTELGANVNLDTLTDVGRYWQTSSSNATVALNYPPSAVAGWLEVARSSSGQQLIQRYTDFNPGSNGSTWIRHRYMGGWSAWRCTWEGDTGWKSTNFSWRAGWSGLSSQQDLLRYRVYRDLNLVYTAPFLASPSTNLTGLTSGVTIATITGSPFDVLNPSRRGNYQTCTHTGTGSSLCSLSVQAVGGDSVFSLAFPSTTAISSSQYVGVPGMWWPLD